MMRSNPIDDDDDNLMMKWIEIKRVEEKKINKQNVKISLLILNGEIWN